MPVLKVFSQTFAQINILSAFFLLSYATAILAKIEGNLGEPRGNQKSSILIHTQLLVNMAETCSPTGYLA